MYPPHVFTPEETETIIRLYAQDGLPCKQVCTIIGMSQRLIARCLKQNGIEIKQREISTQEKEQIVRLFREESATVEALAKTFNYTRQAIRSTLIIAGVFENRGNPNTLRFTQEQIADIVHRYRSLGQSMAVVGNAYECSHGPIRRILKMEGVEIRREEVQQALREQSGHTLMPAGIFHGRRSRALKSGKQWSITAHDIAALYHRQGGRCFYTAIPMKVCSDSRDYQLQVAHDPTALSIDRRDSNGHYTPDNIVLCCRFVNFAKNEWDEKTFRNLLQQIVENARPNIARAA